jgi:hypothetical protein
MARTGRARPPNAPGGSANKIAKDLDKAVSSPLTLFAQASNRLINFYPTGKITTRPRLAIWFVIFPHVPQKSLCLHQDLVFLYLPAVAYDDSNENHPVQQFN